MKTNKQQKQIQTNNIGASFNKNCASNLSAKRNSLKTGKSILYRTEVCLVANAKNFSGLRPQTQHFMLHSAETLICRNSATPRAAIFLAVNNLIIHIIVNNYVYCQ